MNTTTTSQTIITDPVAMPNTHIAMTERMLPAMPRLLCHTPVNVAIARGKQTEALSRYRSTIMRASEDVETALSRYVHGGSEVEVLERQISALRVAREQTQFAYQNGVVGLIDVLDADRELLDASDRLAKAKADQARASVAVFRALGGGWHG